MRAICYLTLLFMTGCAVFDAPTPLPDKDEVVVRIRLTDNLPPYVNGMADWWTSKECLVLIRRSHFPRCITHEAIHCFKGAWHDNKPNSEWCRE